MRLGGSDSKKRQDTGWDSATVASTPMPSLIFSNFCRGGFPEPRGQSRKFFSAPHTGRNPATPWRLTVCIACRRFQLVSHRASILRRRLFNCLAIVSFVLCLAMVVLWVRSYGQRDTIEHSDANPEKMHWIEIGSEAGQLRVDVAEVFALHAQSRGWFYYALPRRQLSVTRASPSFGYTRLIDAPAHDDAGGFSVRSAWFPHWLVAILFALLPALRLRSILRARRMNRPGHCAHCGYDLRATPDRCPECGAVPQGG